MEHIPRTPYPADPPNPHRSPTHPMRLLCLGPSRTATMSTYVALKKLGYTPYHALEAGVNRHWARWNDALRAKYDGIGRKWSGSKDFDQLLWRYDAVTDMPCVLFVDELVEAYPEAKVLLQLRDEESWARSVMGNFAYVRSGWFRWTWLRVFERNLAAFYNVMGICLRVWSNGDASNPQAFQRGLLAHNEHVRRKVPKDRLLEWSAKDGWEPLCKFLGKEPPRDKSGKIEPFPRINEEGFTRGLLDYVLFAAVLRTAKGVAIKLGAVGAVVAAVWFYRQKGLELGRLKLW